MTASSPKTGRDRTTLRIEDLCVVLASPAGPVTALERISLEVGPGECLAVLGESGSGKSTLAMACLGLMPQKGAVATGRILFEDTDLLRLPAPGLRRLLGRRIGYVGQDSYAAFDPFFTIGRQLMDAFRAHAAPDGASARIASVLRGVGLELNVLKRYPHELSGGMLQRVQVAAALLHGPSLLVADEPTSALDPVRRADIAALLEQARRRAGAALLLTTHDLALASRLADRVAVLHRGRLVEAGEASGVIHAPGDPLTARLVEAARRTALCVGRAS